MDEEDGGFKTCTCCNRRFPATEEYFYRDSRKEGRLLPICKNCKNEQEKLRRKKISEAKYLQTHPEPGKKLCVTCHKLLDATTEFFLPVKGNRDGLDGSCRKCTNLQTLLWRQSRPEYIARQEEKEKRQKDRLPDELSQRCSQCKIVKPLSEFYYCNRTKSYRSECKECGNNRSKSYEKKNKTKLQQAHLELRISYKALTYIHYGGNPSRCENCGESNLEFLTLDHINCDGRIDRQLNGAGFSIINAMMRTGFRSDLRLLCENCNWLSYLSYKATQKKDVEQIRPILPESIKQLPRTQVTDNQVQRLCLLCGRYLSIGDFNRDNSRKDGYYPYCKACCSTYQKKRGPSKYQEKRLIVLSHYSDGKLECACCGESNSDLLTLQHINGDGKEERKNLTKTIWQTIIDKGFPPGYEILCWNCHGSLSRHKYCPHKERPKDSKFWLLESAIKNILANESNETYPHNHCPP